MSANFFDRQRAALDRLQRAVQARAAAETDVVAAFTEASEKADRDVQRTRRTNAANRQKTTEELDAAHAEAVQATAAHYHAERAALNAAYEERKRVVAERYREAEKNGRSDHKDKLWAIDAVLEGGEKKAADARDLLVRQAASADEQADDIRARAEPEFARAGFAAEDFVATAPAPDLADGETPAESLEVALEKAEAALDELAGLKSPRLATTGGMVAFVAAGLLVGVGIGFSLFAPPVAAGVMVVGALAAAGGWFAVRSVARTRVAAAGAALADRLAEAAAAAERVRAVADSEYAAEKSRLTEKHFRNRVKTDNHYLPLLDAQKQQFEADGGRAAAELTTAREALAKRQGAETAGEQESYLRQRAEAETRFDAELEAAEAQYADRTAAATSARDTAWAALETAWHAEIAAVAAELRFLERDGNERFPPSWDAVRDPARPLPETVPEGVRYGEMPVSLESLPSGVPADPRLTPADPFALRLPAFLPFPDRAALLLRVRDEGRDAAVTALQAVMLRFLTGLPPGKVRFTVIDPVGLGNNFAAFMHLADHDEALITSQIWTEPGHVERRLADLTDHIASVIQKYLRNQYKSIEEYNRAAGEVAEPYRVLVIANFPTNFTPEAARRLVSIAQSGPSCGVCTLVSVDTRLAMPRDFALADLEAVSLTLAWKDGAFLPKDPVLAAFPPALDAPPGPAATADMVQRVGRASKTAARVEVPFDFIAPKPEEVWAGNSAKTLAVPIGRAGATRRQMFTVGTGTAQHALVAGKTGSGKSTLLHALITNLALHYSPDEAELYLIDFKEGVEFKDYAAFQLPHARVVAIESEREFGLSVLQRLDGILRERGDAFRTANVNDLAGYRAYLKRQSLDGAGPPKACPRILLVVDEFQQFFVEDDKLAQESALLLDRLVRQGRAFGMHVLLGSQTLGGAYSLARSTIDQMAVRIALQCSEADAQLILSKDNAAARLLSRPGEAIYNDQNGLVEGNDPFQVVWLPDARRDEFLADLRTRAGGRYPPPLVFEGNAAAKLPDNPALAARLAAPPAATKSPTVWLGDPISIKEPTAVAFRQQGGANLLVLGQAEDSARALFAAAAVSVAAQVPTPDQPGSTVTVLDGTPDDSPEADDLRRWLNHFPEHVRGATRSDVPAVLAELAAEVERRQTGAGADRAPRFLLVFGLHRFRELRKADDDFGFGRRGERTVSPAERFTNLLKDGPAVGVHVLVWCDTLNNLNRAVDRQTAREFALRVLFQMGAADSSTLVDTPIASRLGRNRALLVQEEQERPEKFRPYGAPPADWLRETAEKVRGRVALSAVAAAG